MHSASSSRALLSSTTAVAWTVLFLAFSLQPARAALTLVEKGKSAYSIVVATNALPSERYAGQELQTYIRKITGVTLPIITDATRGASREILLGDTYRSRKLGIAVDEAGLGTDGFVLRTAGKRLVIAGGKPRGTLYGVYELLEGKLGVRWFTPEVEAVPATNRLSLPALNETKIPALEYREVFWTEMMRDADFSARHRLNGNHYKTHRKAWRQVRRLSPLRAQPGQPGAPGPV